MQFVIADTLQKSLERLSGDEQTAVKATVFDFQVNPANPGHKFHKLDRAQDKRFWSVRVSRDIRLIVHRTDEHVALCYVGHHDDAYAWAERRKLETHRVTGAAQFVEIPTVEASAKSIALGAAKAPGLLDPFPDSDLLLAGIPESWLPTIRTIRTEDDALDVASRLPAEAGEVVLHLAAGGHLPEPVALEPLDHPFAHPDAQRRFRLVTDVAELERALDYPWELWTVFLHPEQRAIVEREFGGPAKVAGSAGTGKTVVALHRAAHLARSRPEVNVLLATFNDALADQLRVKLARLVGQQSETYKRVTVGALKQVALTIHGDSVGPAELVSSTDLKVLVEESLREFAPGEFSVQFVLDEWNEIADAWQVKSWSEYSEVPRIGRKTRLSKSRRESMWNVLQAVREKLDSRDLLTLAEVNDSLREQFASGAARPFTHVVIDESQDVSASQLRLLGALAPGPNQLFFAGDLGQRIFRTPFSWLSAGVDIRGRSKTLYVNYRTSQEIRSAADRLLPDEIRDADGEAESRLNTVSVFRGPKPDVVVADDVDAEVEIVSSWLRSRREEGFAAGELAVFVREEGELSDRVVRALDAATLPSIPLSEANPDDPDHVHVGTMHEAKGMEFRAVVVMGCDEESLPLQSRIESVGDEADLQDVYDTERHLLYVAATRARDRLLVTGVSPASEFLGDLG